jgi:DNA-binding transcriptional MerR regulator
MANQEQWTLAELAAETGVPPRTIRYYIARGILDGPRQGGRGAWYDRGHVAQLGRIREWQEAGWTLARIEAALDHRGADLPEPEAWQQYRLSGDVVVWVRAGLPGWRGKQVRAACEEFARNLRAIQQQGEQE